MKNNWFFIWNFKPNLLPLHHTNKQTENMEAIKNQIEQTAKELGINEVEMIQKMQAVLVERGDEKGILELHVLKMEYAKKLKLI